MLKALDDSDIRRVAEHAKADILKDMSRGEVPSTCRSFSELHDHVDADMYVDGLVAGLDLDSEQWIEHANAVQSIVDQWLRAGRPDSGRA